MDDKVMFFAPGPWREARQIVQGSGDDSGGTGEMSPGFHFVPAEPCECSIEGIHLVVKVIRPVAHGEAEVQGL